MTSTELILPAKIRAALRNAICEQSRGLLIDHDTEIHQTLGQCYKENEKPKFRFPVRISAEISPDGAGWTVETTIKWGIQHSATSTPTTVGEADMFAQDDGETVVTLPVGKAVQSLIDAVPDGTSMEISMPGGNRVMVADKRKSAAQDKGETGEAKK